MCQPCPVKISGRFLLWGAVAAAVVVAAGAVVAIVLTGGDADDQAAQDVTWTRPAANDDCPPDGRQLVTAYFQNGSVDAEMRAAAEKLRDDDKAATVMTETQDEAYARFLKIFADRPDLTSLARKEALPASVNVLPVDGVSLNALADHLRDVLPKADDVEVGGCVVPSR
jgi:hypothetical protein